MDFGRSDDPRVQAQLDRLNALSVPQGRLGLEAITALMERLGNPHRNLPPTFHVAGTNGKGSTCAFLRAMLEADGKVVHVTTSPHLVRYNERFRVAGKLIEDDRLAELLEEVFDAAEGLGCSFFEITIAAAFVEFARVPADACVVEVGLGGRLDATNVLEPDVLAACGIAALGLDHERFLLAPEDGVPKEPMARIAFEKAGIAKRGVPLVTLGTAHSGSARLAIRQVSDRAMASLREMGHRWDCSPTNNHFYFYDENQAEGPWWLPQPDMPGPHQIINAALAVAMLRSQSDVAVSYGSIAQGIAHASWPARMQRLSDGPLTALAPDQTVWLDGGHNPSAGEAIAAHFEGQQVHLILGMIEGKYPRALLDPLGDRVRSLAVVPVPGHPCYPPQAFGPDARAASDIEDALLNVPFDGYPILIAGSLYLAGEVLRLNDEIPD